jgi:hypothetical protein
MRPASASSLSHRHAGERASIREAAPEADRDPVRRNTPAFPPEAAGGAITRPVDVAWADIGPACAIMSLRHRCGWVQSPSLQWEPVSVRHGSAVSARCKASSATRMGVKFMIRCKSAAGARRGAPGRPPTRSPCGHPGNRRVCQQGPLLSRDTDELPDSRPVLIPRHTSPPGRLGAEPGLSHGQRAAGSPEGALPARLQGIRPAAQKIAPSGHSTPGNSRSCHFPGEFSFALCVHPAGASHEWCARQGRALPALTAPLVFLSQQGRPRSMRPHGTWRVLDGHRGPRGAAVHGSRRWQRGPVSVAGTMYAGRIAGYLQAL